MQYTGVEMPLEHGIDALLTLHAVLADKFGADDHRFKVVTVTFDGQVFAWQTLAQQGFGGLGVNHEDQFLRLEPRCSRASVKTVTMAKAVVTTARLIWGATSDTPKKP